MGPGITLIVLGAILAFAVRTDASVVDLQTVGLIFMLAGAAIIAYYRRENRRKEVVTHVERQGAEGASDLGVHHESVIRQRVYDDDL